ncbi:MAG: hypothetical protein MHM6MM_003879 [Cercozoa sp. M6MM]
MLSSAVSAQSVEQLKQSLVTLSRTATALSVHKFTNPDIEAVGIAQRAVDELNAMLRDAPVFLESVRAKSATSQVAILHSKTVDEDNFDADLNLPGMKQVVELTSTSHIIEQGGVARLEAEFPQRLFSSLQSYFHGMPFTPLGVLGTGSFGVMLDEARALSLLSEAPGVVRHSDAYVLSDGYNEHVVIVEEYLGSHTLKSFVPQLRRDFDAATQRVLLLRWSLQMAGLTHNDIKTTNVMVHKGNAILVDFGASRVQGEKGAPIGSVPFMAPEVLADLLSPGGADRFFAPSSDCFSLHKAVGGGTRDGSSAELHAAQRRRKTLLHAYGGVGAAADATRWSATTTRPSR